MAVITVPLKRDIPIGTKCSYMMQVGKRTGFYHAPRMAFIKRKFSQRRCPNAATRRIDGSYFCSMHGPD